MFDKIKKHFKIKKKLTKDNVEIGQTYIGVDYYGNPFEKEPWLAKVVDIRNGFGSRIGELMAEGVVAKPAVELFGRDGKRIITKIKHSDFR